MMTIRFAGAIALALLAAACGEKQGADPAKREPASATPAPSVPAQIYSGSGTVQSLTGDTVAIAHGPIAGIGWPAMTMTFTAPPGVANGVKAGDQVGFSFRKDGSAYVLTSLKRRS